jgi:hypothetical protein
VGEWESGRGGRGERERGGEGERGRVYFALLVRFRWMGGWMMDNR